MTDRHRRLTRLFHAARELPADRVDAFLVEESPDDPSLRNSVLELLELPTHGSTPSSTLLAGDAKPPFAIGRYEVHRRLGIGGMGVVYLARQIEPITREVALKLLRHGLPTDESIRRFKMEQQTIASMSHTNIARMFDAGATRDGQPYFAMEYVEGPPITAYADSQRLRIPERLRLILQVSDGVTHAHQKGIIHRDLKPSNVLVAEENGKAVPKIIDFGIAKALFAEPLEVESCSPALVVGTPEYMSPEQISGDPDVDTRSDVYSLGALLYELVTGESPFARWDSWEELKSRVRKSPPTPPARLARSLAIAVARERAERRCVTSRRWIRQLDCELESITAKALEKDRERRYQTPAEFAEDLRRYLARRPVSARRPTAWYVARTFVRRHRLGTAAVAVLVVTGALAAWRLLDERRRANRSEIAAREALDFLVSTFAGADPTESRGRTITAQEILARSALRLRQEPKDAAVRATLGVALGDIYSSLGLYPEAEPLLRDSVGLFREIAGEQDHQTLIAKNGLGALLFKTGRYDEAAGLFRSIEAGCRKTLGADHRDTLTSMNDLATVLEARGEFAEADELYTRTLQRRREVLGIDDPDTLVSVNNLGHLRETQGRLDEAKELYRDCLERRKRVLGADHPLTLISAGNLAGVLESEGDLDGAERYYQEALHGLQNVLGNDHPDTLNALGNLAYLRDSQGRLDEARELLEQTISGRIKSLGPDHPETLISINNLGNLYLSQEKYADAERIFRDVVVSFRKQLGDEHEYTLMALNNLGCAGLKTGHLSEAEQVLTAAHDGYARRFGPEHESSLNALANLCAVYVEERKCERAQHLLANALRRATQLGGVEHDILGKIHQIDAQALVCLKRYDEAKIALTEAVGLLSGDPQARAAEDLARLESSVRPRHR